MRGVRLRAAARRARRGVVSRAATGSCSRETAINTLPPPLLHPVAAEKRAIIDKYHYLFPRTGGYCRYNNISNLKSGDSNRHAGAYARERARIRNGADADSGGLGPVRSLAHPRSSAETVATERPAAARVAGPGHATIAASAACPQRT
jgi:hypothetical protein